MRKKQLILRLFKEAKPIWHWLFLGAMISAVSVLCAVATPEILGELIQRIYDFYDNGCVGTIRDSLLSGLVVLFLVYALSGLMNFINMRLMNQVVSRYFTYGLRTRISDKIKRLPVGYVDQTSVGDILSRMTDDVGEMGGYVHQIFDILVKGLFQLLLISAIMLSENWKLAVLVLLMTPLSVFLSIKIAAASEKYYERMFTQHGKLTDIVEESFSNYPTIKAYNLEAYSSKRHGQENEKLQEITIKANFMGSIVQPLIRLSNAVAYILLALIGGWMIAKQGVAVGIVVAIILYARQFASPLEELAYGFGRINQVRAASSRVFEILDMPEEDNPEPLSVKETKGCVEIQAVNFAYSPDRPLIDNLSLRVCPGQKIAIVGPTGAGKTTIVNLLMRFYDPVSGSILLDGIKYNNLSREQVRSSFGMVLQDTWLFRGTIFENVAYGKENATREEVVEACRKAQCDHFIRTLPDGYDTVIGEDTTNLSGGQKQLLTIARVVLADRPLLILDEATSNVDTRTEVLIQKAMDELMKGKTCFVIAHRLSTIVNSDIILVMNDGKIVEQGTHRELLAAKGFYHTLYKSQYAV